MSIVTPPPVIASFFNVIGPIDFICNLWDELSFSEYQNDPTHDFPLDTITITSRFLHTGFLRDTTGIYGLLVVNFRNTFQWATQKWC